MSQEGLSGKQKLYFITNIEALTFGSVAQTRGYEELLWKNSEATCKLNRLFQNSQSNFLGYERWRKTHSIKNAAESSPSECPQAIESVTLSPSMCKCPLCPWRRNPARHTAIKLKKNQVPIPNDGKQIFMPGTCGQKCQQTSCAEKLLLLALARYIILDLVLKKFWFRVSSTTWIWERIFSSSKHQLEPLRNVT